MPKKGKQPTGTMWTLDLDNITSFIFGPETEGGVKSFIKEIYDGSDGIDGLKLKEKIITEGKNANISNEQRVKAELIRWLLDSMDDIIIPDGRFELGDLALETLSQKLALNTLYQYGFIN